MRSAQRLVGRAREQIGGRQIDVDDAAPFIVGQLPQRLRVDDAGIGDERIEPLEPLGEGRDCIVCGLLLRYIALDQADAAGIGCISALEAAARQVDHAHAPVVLE